MERREPARSGWEQTLTGSLQGKCSKPDPSDWESWADSAHWRPEPGGRLSWVIARPESRVRSGPAKRASLPGQMDLARVSGERLEASEPELWDGKGRRVAQ